VYLKFGQRIAGKALKAHLFSSSIDRAQPCETACNQQAVSLVRLKGLEPTRIAAREPKGTVTSVKIFIVI